MKKCAGPETDPEARIRVASGTKAAEENREKGRFSVPSLPTARKSYNLDHGVPPKRKTKPQRYRAILQFTKLPSKFHRGLSKTYENQNNAILQMFLAEGITTLGINETVIVDWCKFVKDCKILPLCFCCSELAMP